MPDSLLWSVPWAHHVILMDKVPEIALRRWYMEQALGPSGFRNNGQTHDRGTDEHASSRSSSQQRRRNASKAIRNQSFRSCCRDIRSPRVTRMPLTSTGWATSRF